MARTSVRNYAILYPRRRVDPSGVGVAGGGNALLTTDSHNLDGPEHLHPDAYAKATVGGEEGLKTHGATGATETIDLADGNYHYCTLDAACTFTFTGATAGYGDSFLLELEGSFAPTWPASVITNDTDPETGTRLWTFVTRNGGTDWYGFLAGGGASSLDELTDVTITSPAAGHKLRYDGSGWVNANLHDEPMIAPDGSVMTDGLLNPMMHEVAW